MLRPKLDGHPAAAQHALKLVGPAPGVLVLEEVENVGARRAAEGGDQVGQVRRPEVWTHSYSPSELTGAVPGPRSWPSRTGSPAFKYAAK
jgi:hypothetical protein